MEIKPQYKDIANYLRNELEITRDYVEQVLEKSISNQIKQYLENTLTEEVFNKAMTEAVKCFVTNTNGGQYSTNERFSKAVIAEVERSLNQILSSKYNISVVVKTKSV